MSCLCCSTESAEVEQVPAFIATEEQDLPSTAASSLAPMQAGGPAYTSYLKQEAASSASCFTVRLEKFAQDTPIGLYLDISDGRMLHVCGMRLGSNPAQAYNASVPDHLQIKSGDFVSKVNGASGDAKQLVEALTTNTSLELQVHRPALYTVKVNKKANGMGLDVNYAMQGKSLVVEGLHEGAIKTWNDQNPHNAISKGDRIVAVDGVEGTAWDLLAKLSERDEVELLCSRPGGVARPVG